MIIKDILFFFAIILLYGVGILFAQVPPSSFNNNAQQKRVGQRLFQPEDLFRVWQIGASKWSPDGRRSAIEVLRPGRTIDRSVPTGEIRVLDAETRSLRIISSPSSAYIGFFNPIWSPDSRHLAFLSVDENAVVQPWIWTVGTKTARPLTGFDVKIGLLDNPIAWAGNNQIAIVAWEKEAEKSGPLYFRITRGQKIAEGYKRAAEMKAPTVSVLESQGIAKSDTPNALLKIVDIRSGKQRTLAQGGIHRLSVSEDGRFISFLRESPGIPNQPVSSYFAFETVDEAYDAVNWGTSRNVIDAQTGNLMDSSSMTANPSTVRTPRAAIPAPKPGARLLSAAPGGDAALFITNDSEGSKLWIVGGKGQSLTESFAVWEANEWVREIKLGAAELISYKSSDGKHLTAWLLLPPNHTPGTKIPIVTIVYPGQTFGQTAPGSFSLLQPNFEHPQLFAALGYGVLLPSMPEDESRSLQQLPNGVLPAIDAIVERGIADSNRIAVLGQSDGGFAVLGLLTQTNRFRSAIASAGFSNLVSLYGTFYGQHRYGDAGHPQSGAVLRMLQLEKGYGGMGGAPWAFSSRYRESSAILQADKVMTPLMLVHGDLDFVPIQQSEEFFTALYRQDKRAVFVRYQGEWHTIANRPNVLDLWQRFSIWLAETTAPRTH
ncbi:MAG: tolB protein precursor, periplasmic protein involved in the tonb-independent uptake of group A colicins [uncultured Pyrinomonadaceae bacterium]|uniref:TolB protein, periplasmic protein involved in the tonb-independent uptake of group A colicins n=1 Tax=uncultured Pyrinomonadaceae bacterium TaxID=2283094 RepID=A0A6J4P7U4_9BACT|nr:MAG: tolB protein precursor, periplasmic protein involved in the tonb-independent uptake of group A colicins [uncultured Pyrinomonadaceae bacterium]